MVTKPSLFLVQSEKGHSKLLEEVTGMFVSNIALYNYSVIERHKQVGTTEEGAGNRIKRHRKGKVQNPPPPLPHVGDELNEETKMKQTKISQLTLEVFLAHPAV